MSKISEYAAAASLGTSAEFVINDGGTTKKLTTAVAWAFGGAVSVAGAATLSSTLTVAGAATLSSTLAVAGAASFSGNVSAGGQFLAADGTFSAPGIAFTGQPNTGFYRSGAGINIALAGGTQFVISSTASAVNYVQVTGSAAGGNPTISTSAGNLAITPTLSLSDNLLVNAVGKAIIGTTDTLRLSTFGSYSISFSTNADTTAVEQFRIAHTASAVNYVQATGGATGAAVTVGAAGTDADIDLALSPKGTGNMRFGTWTTNADAAVNGYVTIKDSGGTVRKLATIA